MKERTKEFDKDKRNLNAHYREGNKLNIVERYEVYSNQNHADAMVHCLALVNLCKNMDAYTMHGRRERLQEHCGLMLLQYL